VMSIILKLPVALNKILYCNKQENSNTSFDMFCRYVSVKIFHYYSPLEAACFEFVAP
jgi:hypothetical protein